jgi:ribulose kinase
MDHRSISEAEEINESKDPVLKYVGGKISPGLLISCILLLFIGFLIISEAHLVVTFPP